LYVHALGFVPCDHITCPDAIFDNLRGAPARLWKGIVVSDAIKRSLENTRANQKTGAWLEARTDATPPIHANGLHRSGRRVQAMV
jgi:hypothetical protein